MSAGQPSQTSDGYQPFTPSRPDSSTKMPVMAIVLTLIGDFIYLNFGVGIFIGFAASGLFSYASTVLFITTVGVIGCVVMMAVRPKMHLTWGVLVIVLSLWAVTADEPLLLGSFNYSYSVGGPIAIVGAILWNIPLGLVLLGGFLAIRWKPTASVSGSAPLSRPS